MPFSRSMHFKSTTLTELGLESGSIQYSGGAGFVGGFMLGYGLVTNSSWNEEITSRVREVGGKNKTGVRLCERGKGRGKNISMEVRFGDCCLSSYSGSYQRSEVSHI